MKIFKNNAVYVERSDIDYVKFLPYEVFLEMEKTNFFDERFFKFVTYKSIDFFKENDIIIDYNSLKDLSDEELREKINIIERHLLSLGEAIANLTIEEDNRHLLINSSKDLENKRLNAKYMQNTIKNYRENKAKYDDMFSNLDETYTKTLKL